MKTVVVTGANRGIGLELVKQYKDRGYKVISVCRISSDELRAFCDEVISGIDVSLDECIPILEGKVKGLEIDVLINNAGLLEGQTVEDLDMASIAREMQVNALGPLRVFKALQKNLKSGCKVVMITSRLGSIKDNSSGGYYGYRMSKAALNMAMRTLSIDLRDQGILTACVHPGYVRTRMTGNTGDLEPKEAASGIIARADELNTENTGFFRHSQGQELDW